MTIVVRYSEEYDSSTGTLDFSSTGGVKRAQEDRCICDGQEFFFTHLLGIQQKEGSCGYKELIIQPAEVSGLDWVKGSVRLGDSIVSVSIRKDENGKQIVASKVSQINSI